MGLVARPGPSEAISGRTGIEVKGRRNWSDNGPASSRRPQDMPPPFQWIAEFRGFRLIPVGFR